MRNRLLLLALLALLLPGARLGAQGVSEPEEQRNRSGWSLLRLSKWTSLAATIGTAIYGVSTITGADADYERLELACRQIPLECRSRMSTGRYSDAELERQYQAVLRQDHRARAALLVSQIGVATTVALFILDLRHARAPADIPYDPPRRLELVPRTDGVELRYTLPSR
jgi:hypothetical protein